METGPGRVRLREAPSGTQPSPRRFRPASCAACRGVRLATCIWGCPGSTRTMTRRATQFRALRKSSTRSRSGSRRSCTATHRTRIPHELGITWPLATQPTAQAEPSPSQPRGAQDDDPQVQWQPRPCRSTGRRDVRAGNRQTCGPGDSITGFRSARMAPPQPGAPPQRTACVQSSAPGFSWLWGGWADADRSAEQGFRRRRVVGVLSALMAARPWPWRAVVRERRRSRAWRRS